MSKEFTFWVLTFISVLGVVFGIIVSDPSIIVVGGFAVFFFGSCIGLAHDHP